MRPSGGEEKVRLNVKKKYRTVRSREAVVRPTDRSVSADEFRRKTCVRKTRRISEDANSFPPSGTVRGGGVLSADGKRPNAIPRERQRTVRSRSRPLSDAGGRFTRSGVR